VLKNRQFIFGGVVVAIGSLFIVSFIFSLSSLGEVVYYKKAEAAIVVSAAPLQPSAEEVAAVVDVTADQEEDKSLETPGKVDEENNEEEAEETELVESEIVDSQSVPVVPFFSQFEDISPASWKKVGCGIASLAMLIEYYDPGVVVVDNLLQEGIEADAYLDDAGWTYAGLIGVSKKYGMGGQAYDLGNLSMEKAYGELLLELEEGPVMASVHYTFQKSNPIPHLVIINGIDDGKVYYNDPAEETGGGSVSVAQFQSAWKKRYIEFRLL